MQIGIPSEIDRLHKVIVHTPGREVSLVNPELKDELLFDDIIFEEDARGEHLDMLDVFKAAMPEDGKIYEILDLAADCLKDSDTREGFVSLMVQELHFENLHAVEKELKTLDSETLLKFVVQGAISPNHHFTLNPAPNLLFTRDLAAVAGNHIIVSKAAKEARMRESLLMEMIVKNHPLFEPVRENAIYIGGQQSIEGGDVLVVSEKIVLIGMSERTSFSGLMNVTEKLLKSNVDHVLAVDIPKKRSSMHLDTIFTFADETECVVFPPAIEEQKDNVVELFKNGDAIETRTHRSLKSSLEDLTGKEFTFIRCGGEDRTTQFREQWTDGANVFALAPGVIVGYERNTKTFKELEKYGYRFIDQYSFIEEFGGGKFDPVKAGKLAISFQGHELCRGRGGARCMTQPLLRK